MKRALLLVTLTAVAVSGFFAASAFGHFLSFKAASTKSFYYAKRACNVDRYCDRYGVRTCRRQQPHVVICEIFNDRDTPGQGRYRCTRLVRIAYRTPSSLKPTITGFSKWDC